MSDINDDDITTEPTEADEDRDKGGHGAADTGDEPTEADEDRDAGGEGREGHGRRSLIRDRARSLALTAGRPGLIPSPPRRRDR